jgi:exopolyphosphatase/guanosine-5'-triphosphate,3'-diphosphate pyrophosphatase
MPRAAIDLGSNSVLLTVLADDGAVVHDEARVVGLGKGLGDHGRFAPDRMAAAQAALADYANIARSMGVLPKQVQAVATSAARRAENAREWLEQIKALTGLHFRIISGDEEAQLTWAGVTSDIAAEGQLIAFDLGGGSTEVVIGSQAGLEKRISLEVGSVRHTEAYLGTGIIREDQLSALREDLQQTIERIPFALGADVAIGVAGTVTTLAAMELGLRRWDATKVHKSPLSREALQRWSARLAAVDRAERVRLAAVCPERADYLVAGAEILVALLRASGLERLYASDRGIRYGLLTQRLRKNEACGLPESG